MTGSTDLHDDVSELLGRETRVRRLRRSRRTQVLMVSVLAIAAMIVVAAPSIVCHSSMGRSLVANGLGAYGLQGGAEEIRISWGTPLHLKGVHAIGASGVSRLTVDQVDADVTVMDLILGRSAMKHVIVRGVDLECQVGHGRCSLEDDLAAFFQDPQGEDAATGHESRATGHDSTGHIEVTDIRAQITDAVNNHTWQVTQAAATVEMTTQSDQASTQVDFTGVLSEQNDASVGGALEGQVELADDRWTVRLASEGLPLSIASIARRRFPELSESIPAQLRGDATGQIELNGEGGRLTDASIQTLQVRDLTALAAAEIQSQSDDQQGSADQTAGRLLWQNSLATLDGTLELTEKRLIGKHLVATSDFGSIQIDGAFSRDFSWTGAADNPLRWLEEIDGLAEVQLDLPKLQAALPGILPIRSDARIAAGRATASLRSLPAGSSLPRSEIKIDCDAIQARSGDRDVFIEPIELTGVVAGGPGGVHAERFRWTSSFGRASGQGDLASGWADVEVDFGRLYAMLQPVIDFADAQLSGVAEGKIRWDMTTGETWNLNGTGGATNLLVTLPGGRRFQRNQIRGDIQAVGRAAAGVIDDLQHVVVNLSSDAIQVKAELLEPVQRPNWDRPLLIGLQSSGDLETLQQIAAAWLPDSLQRIAGQYHGSAITQWSPSTTSLQRLRLACQNLIATYDNRTLRQSRVQLAADGQLDLIGLIGGGTLQVTGEGLSASAEGELHGDQIQASVRWQADLNRLQGIEPPRLAGQPAVSPVSFYQDAVTAENIPGAMNRHQAAGIQWTVLGQGQGELRLTKTGSAIKVTQQTDAQHLMLIRPSPREPLIGQNNQIQFADRQAPQQTRVVWTEPNLKLSGTLLADSSWSDFGAEGFEVAGDWFAAAIDGKLRHSAGELAVDLGGPVRLDMEVVAAKLKQWAGVDIELSGVHESTLDLHIDQATQQEPNTAASIRPTTESSPLRIQASTQIGWDSGQLAGVRFGAASCPIEITPSSVIISPTRIPVGDGFVRAAGQVFYQGDRPVVRLEPGVLAQSIQLTPQQTDQWLKYLAPVAADSARISGVVSARLREASIVLGDANQTRVLGQLDIEGVEMTAGPLADQILAGVNQLSSLATLVGGRATQAKPGQQLITMPVQTVDFSVDRGIVAHDRMYFQIDRASVVTSGQVGLDGRLGITAQVPLDQRWLGNDLKGLAGQSITLPISGTLGRPSVDANGVNRLVKDVGSKAIQQTTENFLQKQLERGFEKILGR